VELVLNNEVHPYDLLRYERAIFSKAAIEQLTEMLEKNASKRKLAAPPRRRPRNADTLYRDSPPADYRKGLGVKETEGTLVFDVAPEATKTEVKQAVEALFKVKVAAVRTANVVGKERRRGKFAGFAGLEEGLRPAEGRREAAGVREQPVKQLLVSAFSLVSARTPAWEPNQELSERKREV
jgi:ribosomal protein L23